MGIGEHFPVVLDLATGHAGGTQESEPVRGRTRRGHLLDQRDQRADVSPPEISVREARITLEVLERERSAERRPCRPGRRTEDEVSVGGTHRLIRPHEAVRRPGGARHLAGREIRSGLPHRERHGRLEHRDIDELPATVAHADGERRQNADRRVEAGHEIGDRYADLHRRPVLRAGHAHQAAHRLHDDVERGSIRVRPVEAPPRHGGVDEATVGVEQRARVEAEVGHRAGSEVLDDDVGSRREPAEHIPARVLLEVERDAALAAVEADEVPALAVDERLEPARKVATARILDPDDVGIVLRRASAFELERVVEPDARTVTVRRGPSQHAPQCCATAPARSLHTPAFNPSEPMIHTSSARGNTLVRSQAVPMSMRRVTGGFGGEPGLTNAPSTESTTPRSPTIQAVLPALVVARSGSSTPESTLTQRAPDSAMIVPPSPTATALLTFCAAIARSVASTPVGTGRHPAGSSRYAIPPAPTVHADSGPNATIARRSSSMPRA